MLGNKWSVTSQNKVPFNDGKNSRPHQLHCPYHNESHNYLPCNERSPSMHEWNAQGPKCGDYRNTHRIIHWRQHPPSQTPYCLNVPAQTRKHSYYWRWTPKVKLTEIVTSRYVSLNTQATVAAFILMIVNLEAASFPRNLRHQNWSYRIRQPSSSNSPEVTTNQKQ